MVDNILNKPSISIDIFDLSGRKSMTIPGIMRSAIDIDLSVLNDVYLLEAKGDDFKLHQKIAVKKQKIKLIQKAAAENCSGFLVYSLPNSFTFVHSNSKRGKFILPHRYF